VQAFWRDDSPADKQLTQISAIERRGWFTRSDTTPFAILSLRLATMSDKGFPPRAIAHHISPYYSENDPQRSFEFFDFPFTFLTKAAIKDFKNDMATLAGHLKQ
jgi:hypothetical protein